MVNFKVLDNIIQNLNNDRKLIIAFQKAKKLPKLIDKHIDLNKSLELNKKSDKSVNTILNIKRPKYNLKRIKYYPDLK